MATRILPSQQELEKRFSYDPATGILTRRPRPRSDFSTPQAYAVYCSMFAGKPCLADRGNGYLFAVIDNRPCLVHRIIWKMLTGQEPARLDHIDGDPSYQEAAVRLRGEFAGNHR